MKSKIVKRESIKQVLQEKHSGQRIVFTNGCFDIIHAGHIAYLEDAKAQGDVLVLGLNSDSSIQRIKGKNRPINSENERAYVLAALEIIDFVVVFEEDTPYNLINIIKPDVLVKGGDWSVDQIIGSDIVIKSGGEVKSLTFKKGFSSTNVINKIIDLYCTK